MKKSPFFCLFCNYAGKMRTELAKTAIRMHTERHTTECMKEAKNEEQSLAKALDIIEAVGRAQRRKSPPSCYLYKLDWTPVSCLPKICHKIAIPAGAGLTVGKLTRS